MVRKADTGFDFRWVLPGALAGASQPGLLRDLSRDLAVLEANEIRLLVTLTETPLAFDGRQFGIRQIHFPIADMGIPTPRGAHTLCRDVGRSIERHEAVTLHCRAGLGRTGMMLACFLATDGLEPAAAIAAVRKVCALHIQSPAQEHFVHHYAEFLDTRESSQRHQAHNPQLPPLKLPDTESHR